MYRANSELLNVKAAPEKKKHTHTHTYERERLKKRKEAMHTWFIRNQS